MNKIEIIARGIIIQDGKILLCKVKSKENWFFPGGHVEEGENSEAALKREMREEIGVDTIEAKFIGLAENIFTDEKNIVHQEINVVFEAKIEKTNFECLEEHLEFCWKNLAELLEAHVLPESLKKAVLQWQKDKHIFYTN